MKREEKGGRYEFRLLVNLWSEKVMSDLVLFVIRLKNWECRVLAFFFFLFYLQCFFRIKITSNLNALFTIPSLWKKIKKRNQIFKKKNYCHFSPFDIFKNWTTCNHSTFIFLFLLFFLKCYRHLTINSWWWNEFIFN